TSTCRIGPRCGVRQAEDRYEAGCPAMNRSRLVLPPIIAIVMIITMIMLHIVAPLAIVVPAPYTYAGALLLATGAAMIVWSRRALPAAGTPVEPLTESTL